MKLNRGKRIAKSAAAVFTAAALMVSGAATVFAGGTYQDYEKEAVEALVTGLMESWDKDMENYDKSMAGSNTQLILKAEDAGKSLLSIMTGLDFSWLETIALDMDVSMIDGNQAIDTELLLNDGHIATAKVFADVSNMMQYMQIPELSESYLGGLLTMTGEAEAYEMYDESMQMYLDMMADITSYIPDSAVVETLLERYLNIIIDGMQEGASVEEAVSLGGIEEACTMYEGNLFVEDLIAVAETLLTTARDDQELKNLIETYAVESSEEDLYAEFQDSINDALDELAVEESAAEADEYFSSRIWVNAENEIVAREFALMDGAYEDFMITWENPQAGDESALLLEIYSEGSAITLTGTTQTTDGMKRGSYIFAIDYGVIANVEMENYDVAAAEAGSLKATYTISFPQPETDEEEAVYNPLSACGGILDVDINGETGEQTYVLTVTSGGAALASLTLTGGYGDGVEVPDLEGVEFYDMVSNDDMNAYAEEITFDEIFEYASAAGMPELFVNMLQSTVEEAFYGSSAEATADVAA